MIGDNSSSMLRFLPKIKTLPIPQPRTIVIPIKMIGCDEMDNIELFENWLNQYYGELKNAIKDLGGYPVFLRTDATSNKHSWKETCFVESEEELHQNIYNLMEFHYMADIIGLNAKAFLVREYIEMDTKFTAFYHEFPVGKERRYYVRGGKVLCHHPYWPADAMHEPSIDNWKEELKILNTETSSEIKLLTKYAEEVSKKFGDAFLSVDFCKSKKGLWYLIDMASGFESWHPIDCKIYKEFKEKYSEEMNREISTKEVIEKRSD